MKKAILIFALSRSPWIGGIYYRKNIVNMMLRSKEICSKYHVVIVVNEKNRGVFQSFDGKVSIETCEDTANTITAIRKAIYCCIRYRVKYVFPLMPIPLIKPFGITTVSWIADFQHCWYPEFFEEWEITERNRNFSKMANASNPLVLSSKDSLKDLETYFRKNRPNTYVVHFSSFIDDELKAMEEIDCNEVLAKYGLTDFDYCLICNQFWKHKNHSIVFDAMKKMTEELATKKLCFVFTGEPNDRRDPEYFNLIKSKMNDPEIKQYTKVLGFIDRLDQLVLMKNALFIIQPSLFEGWGTVVEDAKRIGKRIILSDIPVHREQMNVNCTLFDKTNPESLVRTIKVLMEERNKTIEPEDDTDKYIVELEKVFV